MSPGEFESLREVAAELGLGEGAIRPVRRETVDVGDGTHISALLWGEAAPEMVFLHGGGQNAHTWDLVALQLGRPAVALDLPGHGHSSWRDDHDYRPSRSAQAVAVAIEQLAPAAAAVVGMSLGGLTTIALAGIRPDLIAKAVLVDVTPGSVAAWGTMTEAQRGTVALISGPRTFATLEEMVDRAVAASPRRPASAVRRGVVHNSVQQPDGTWAWRYDVRNPETHHRESLWDSVAGLTMPTMLIRGGESRFTADADVDRMRAELPRLRVETVPGAGHSVQSDQPTSLAALISDFVFPR
jgi:pimeloyl-ACP methyl ester carboxylesterase